MKRILGVLFLVGMMVTPTLASAGDQIGVYVAPKFVYGLTQMESAKAYLNIGDYSDNTKIGSKTDDTFGGSLAIGYDFDKKFGAPIRAELEYAGFSEAEAKKTFQYDDGSSETLKQTFTIQTLFVNAYWDIDTGTQFTPYLGAGLGMGFINTKLSDNYNDGAFSWGASTGSRTVTNFAWNIGAGLGYDMTENWTLDVGYRFVGLGSVKTKTKTFDDGLGLGLEAEAYGKAGNLYQHQFAVGVRYTF